jgi:hypothetical protein
MMRPPCCAVLFRLGAKIVRVSRNLRFSRSKCPEASRGTWALSAQDWTMTLQLFKMHDSSWEPRSFTMREASSSTLLMDQMSDSFQEFASFAHGPLATRRCCGLAGLPCTHLRQGARSSIRFVRRTSRPGASSR